MDSKGIVPFGMDRNSCLYTILYCNVKEVPLKYFPKKRILLYKFLKIPKKSIFTVKFSVVLLDTRVMHQRKNKDFLIPLTTFFEDRYFFNSYKGR